MKLAFLLSLLCLSEIGASAQTATTNDGKSGAEVIISNQYHPSEVAVDEDSVYWVNDAGRTIQKMSKTGGTPITVVTGRIIGQILVDEESVFFTVLGEIRRVSKNGGAATTLVKSELIGYQRDQMVVDKTNLYYYEQVGVPPGTMDKNPLLRKVSKGGGTPITLSSNTYMPSDLATDGVNVYWIDGIRNVVKRVSVNGGRVVALRQCLRPIDIAMAADRVYCRTSKGEIINLTRPDRTSIELSKVQSFYGAQRFVFDQMNVYTLERHKTGLGIFRIGKNGGRPELMVEVEFFLRGFVVDNASIYWTEENRGSVMRLRK